MLTRQERAQRTKRKSRKSTLLHVLGIIGNYAGIECYRSPGEDAAVLIACKLIERTSLEELDQIAGWVGKDHPDLKPFWGKQW